MKKEKKIVKKTPPKKISKFTQSKEGKLLNKISLYDLAIKKVNLDMQAELASGIPWEVPDLPDKIRDFAYKYGLEHRSRKEWAELFRVTPQTIDIWRVNPKVVRFALIVKFNNENRELAQHDYMRRKAISAFEDMADTKLTAANFEAKRKAMVNILQFTSGSLPDVDSSIKNNLTFIKSNKITNNQQNNTILVSSDEISTKDLEQAIKETIAMEEALNDEGKDS
jgi:hypothetical protein